MAVCSPPILGGARGGNGMGGTIGEIVSYFIDHTLYLFKYRLVFKSDDTHTGAELSSVPALVSADAATCILLSRYETQMTWMLRIL